MTYMLKLNQIREILNLEVKLEKAKLQDGTEISYEQLQPGFPVTIVAADGSETPAPEGEHVLEDGITKIEVDAQGNIVEISKETDEAPEAPEAEVNDVQVAGSAQFAEGEPTEPTKPEAPVIDAVEEKMKMIFAVVEEVAKDVANIKEEMAAMKTKMEKFSKAPAATPIKKLTLSSEVSDIVDPLDAKLEALNAMRKASK